MNILDTILLLVLSSLLVDVLLVGYLIFLFGPNNYKDLGRLRKMGCNCEISRFGIPTVERDCPVHVAWDD